MLNFLIKVLLNVVCTFSTHLKCPTLESSNMARASKDANMKPQNEINEKHCFELNLTDYYEFILFLYPRELYANFFVFCDDTLIRWKAVCSISILFVDFSAKPMLKSPAQISLKDKHYKLPPTRQQSSTGKLL